MGVHWRTWFQFRLLVSKIAIKSGMIEVKPYGRIGWWHAMAWSPVDRTEIVCFPIGIHWIARGLRWLYYTVKLQYTPEVAYRRRLEKKIWGLEHENQQLLRELRKLRDGRG